MDITNLTKQELEGELNARLQLLKQTDYKARKYIDGEYTQEEYDIIKDQAAEWRKEIRQMSEKLESMPDTE